MVSNKCQSLSLDECKKTPGCHTNTNKKCSKKYATRKKSSVKMDNCKQIDINKCTQTADCLWNKKTSKCRKRRKTTKTKKNAVEKKVPVKIVKPVPTRPQQYVSSLEILFNTNIHQILKNTNYFGNFSNLSKEIIPLGSNSENGFIRKLKYISHEYELSLIQKNNRQKTSDNLVYEYLVGQCVNHFSQYYPCFVKTYQICSYKSTEYFNAVLRATEKTKLSHGFDTMLSKLNIENIDELIKTGCKNNEHLCLIIQYMDFFSSLETQLGYIEPHKLLILLHLIYTCLSSFADQFTHYDLHAKNVQLFRIPDKEDASGKIKPRCVQIRMHLKKGSVLMYKTKYLPVIIDYGRSYVNCSSVNSENILKNVCKFDSWSKHASNRVCKNDCGNARGFWTPEFDHNKQKFRKQTLENWLIDPTRRNISYDLRLLEILKFYFRENLYTSSKFKYSEDSYKDFIIRKVVNNTNAIGQLENTTNSHEKAYNVHSASYILTNIIKNSKFADENKLLFQGHEIYRTIDIWEDLSRPFIVS